MEKFDLFDKNRLPLGKTMVRENKPQEIEEGCYRQVVHVLIFNSKGEMLIQQRQPFKRPFPNLWSLSVGGSAISGETPCDAARRELFEELGIKHDFSNERPFFTINFQNGFDDYFIIKQDVDINSLTLQPEEVQAVKWATCDEILQMMNDGTFISYNIHFMKYIFDAKDKSFGTIFA